MNATGITSPSFELEADPTTFEGFLVRFRRMLGEGNRWELLVPGTWLGGLVGQTARTCHRWRRVAEPLEDFHADVQHRIHDKVLPRLAERLRSDAVVDGRLVARSVLSAARDVAHSRHVKKIHRRAVPISAMPEGFAEAIPDHRGTEGPGAREERREVVNAEIRAMAEADRDLVRLLIDLNGNMMEVSRRMGVPYGVVLAARRRLFARLRLAIAEDAV